MDEQFKPIEEGGGQTPQTGFTSIVEEPPVKQQNPIVNTGNEEILRKLPDWNLEPPVEIDRGK